MIISAIEALILIRAILSWFPNVPNNSLTSALYHLTEPILAPIRGALFNISVLRNLPIDFSTIVAFIILEIVRRLIV